MGRGQRAVGLGWRGAGGTKGLVFLAGVGPKQGLASPSDPPSCCFSHLLSSQYVERHFSREGTTQHSTVSDSGRDQVGPRCLLHGYGCQGGAVEV